MSAEPWEEVPTEKVLVQCDKNPAHKGDAIAAMFIDGGYCHKHPTEEEIAQAALKGTVISPCENDDECDGSLRRVEAYR